MRGETQLCDGGATVNPVRRGCYGVAISGRMKTISHRELRNDSAAVLRAVADGESFLISNHGTTVARLSPANESEPDLRITRRATRHGFDGIPIHKRSERVLDALDDLRGDR